MPRFFIEPTDSDYIEIKGEDEKHISRSLRMKTGDNLTLCDQQGFDYSCVIESFREGGVAVRVEEKRPNTTEPVVAVTLYQALPKGDKLEMIVQKAVELGCVKILPVLTSRCISRPKPKALEGKTKRLQAIALEAAKQANRGIVPQIGELLDYNQALTEMAKAEKSLLFYENATTTLSHELAEMPKELAIMIGCEGGFSPQEVEEAGAQGVQIASLGSRVLRCETAPIAALSAIMLLAGEF